MSTDSTAIKTMVKQPSFLIRWTILIFLGLAMFGNYYVYDSIAPIADMLERELNFSDSAIGTLNAVYSIPNLFMVLIGGIIIDRIGTKRATIAFAFICLAGAIVTAMQDNLLGMAVGRFIFGLGAESLIVAASAAIAKWFRGKELSFAFAMKITLARLGSFAAENSPAWANQWYDDWQTPLIIAVFFALISVVTAILYAVSEAAAEKKYDLAKAGGTDKVEFREIFRFNKSFWYITLLCVTFYSAIFPFKTFAIKMFQHMGETIEYAGFLSSLTTLFAMIFMPIFGLLIDKTGRRALIMLAGSAMLIPVYILIGFNTINLLIPMAILGLAYALVPAVMWPSVAYVVKEHQTGTAYGLMTMVQNIGLIAFNFGIGAVNDVSKAGADNVDGYWPGLLIFSSLGGFGVIWALLLRKNELGPNGHGLERVDPTKKSG